MRPEDEDEESFGIVALAYEEPHARLNRWTERVIVAERIKDVFKE